MKLQKKMKLGEKHDMYIKEFTSRGMVVLPCVNKFPQKLKGWQKMKKSPLPHEGLSQYMFNKYKVAWYDATGFGILCGEVSGITVVDVDTDDIEWINKFMEHHKIPETTKCITPSGGYHLYYKYNKDLKTTTRLGNVSIDIRNDRSFIVAPGSPYDTKDEKKKKYLGTDYKFATVGRKEGEVGFKKLDFECLQEVPEIFLQMQEHGVDKTTFEPLKEKKVLTSKFGIIEEEVEETNIQYPAERKTTAKKLMKLMLTYSEKYNCYDSWRNGLWVWFAAGEDNNFDGVKYADEWSQKLPKYQAGQVQIKYEDWKQNKQRRINISHIIKKLGKQSPAVESFLNLTATQYCYHDYAYMLRNAKENNNYVKILEMCVVDDYLRSAIRIVDRCGATAYYLRIISDGVPQWKLSTKVPFTDEKARFMHITYEKVKEGKKTKLVKKYNLTSFAEQFYNKKLLICPFYRDVDFYPFYGNKSKPSEHILNTFSGYRAKYIKKKNRPSEGITYDRYMYLLNHMKETLCNNNKKFYTYVLRWLSHLLKKSGSQKLQTMLVFVGKQGTGKNLLIEKFFMNGILGSHNGNVVTDLARFTKNFNAERIGKLLHVFNEVSSFALGRCNADKMKSLTDEIFMCEPKGKERFRARDCAGHIFLSNNDLPVKIEQGDRRYACIKMNDKYIGKKDHKYYEKLAKCCYDDNVQNMFFSMLVDLNIEKWNMCDIPHTEHKTYMQENNMDHIVLQYLKEVIEDNTYDYANWYKSAGYYTINEVEEGFAIYLQAKGISKSYVKRLKMYISRRLTKKAVRPREKLKKVRTYPSAVNGLNPIFSDKVKAQCVEISKDIIRELHREIITPTWSFESDRPDETPNTRTDHANRS